LVYCLPLVAGKQEIGVVQLGYAGPIPSPPTKYLPRMLNLAEQAAQVIGQAWTSVKNQKLALTYQIALKQEREREVVQGKDPLQRSIQEASSPDTGSDRPFLEIRCFGAFELYRQGKLVTPEMFPRRGALTLLKVLLIHGGRPVPRDVLVELLWPEADPEATANRLYVLMHTLRRVVEPLHQDQRWVYVCGGGNRYYFNPDAPFRLDVREFLENVSLGERLERAGDVTAAISAYEAAVNLYRGNLLEEEPYAEWCWEEREHLKQVCHDVLRKLAIFYLEKDSAEKSIMAYRRTLRIDHLREDNYRGLMQALWAAGRRDEALREYRVCIDVLQRELGVDPLPETQQLFSLIRNNHGP
jgi:DNA-binding SARP family transcriptional activator